MLNVEQGKDCMPYSLTILNMINPLKEFKKTVTNFKVQLINKKYTNYNKFF